MPQQAYPVPAVDQFKGRLASRLRALADESGMDEFVMPVGLFLLIDTAHGGDATADEVARRFGLLDFESGKVIDFYFLGWERCPGGEGICFSLPAFESFRTALRQNGITGFGGNADLILVDARYHSGRIELDFGHAMRIDLATRAAEKEFATLGAFLQSIVEAAEAVRSSQGNAGSAVFSISDRLGVAIAKKSIIGFFLEMWGKLIGAKEMAGLAVRSLGPTVPLDRF